MFRLSTTNNHDPSGSMATVCSMWLAKSASVRVGPSVGRSNSPVVTTKLPIRHKVPFRVPDDEQIDPGLRDQLSRYRDALGTSIPLGALMTFLRCWTVLYGAVAMEVFGHMRFALEDPAPMFEITLGDLAALVGLRYPLPG